MKALRLIAFAVGIILGVLGFSAIALVSGGGSWGVMHGWPLVVIGAAGLVMGAGLIWLSRRRRS